MSAARSRKGAKSVSEPTGLDAMYIAPQVFLAQSARAALFGLDAFEANLRIWRTIGEALNEIGRRQQDAVVQSLSERISDVPGRPIAATDAASIAAPFEAARVAYEKVGDAVLAAQRRTLEAISEAATVR
jgi:hypothetical protein